MKKGLDMPAIHTPGPGEPTRLSSARRRRHPLSSVPVFVVSTPPSDEEAQLVEDLVALIEVGVVVPVDDTGVVRYAAAESGGAWA